MMATAKQKHETNFCVTLVVPASQIEAAAKQVGGATVQNVEKIEPFVEGAWSQEVYGDNDDEEVRGKPKEKDSWENTDGRRIRKTLRLKPGHEKKPVSERKLEGVYVTSDKYGEIGRVPILEEAKRLLRPVSAMGDLLKAADLMALRIDRATGYSEEQQETAKAYLAMRRIVPVDDTLGDDGDGRRKPQYHVTLTVEGSQKDTILGVAKSLFSKQLVGVELVRHGGSRAEDLDRAFELVEEAKDIVGELKGDLEEWKESLPDNFRDQKEEELDSAISELEDIENSLNINFDNVEFPGAF
jgi:hypothetical protein